MRSVLLLSILAVLASCGGTTDSFLAPEAGPESRRDPELDAGAATLGELHRSTAAFHDVGNAIAAGYAPPDAAACVDVASLGAMGVHSLNLALASDLEVEPLKPEVLLYLPKQDGGFRLIGVEYVVVALVITPTGPAPWFSDSPPPYPFFNPAPSVFGQVFEGPMAGHEPGQPWHYDKHVWVWAPNPSGTFAQFNPTLSCSGAGS